MQINQETINEIREKTDIVDLVSQYVKLEKRGRNYIGLCPFHDEKTPSFTVSEDKQICHCFGCKKGGNVFQFLEQIENITFVQAVKRLGDNVGIAVEGSEEVTYATDNMKMIDMHELLRDYYHYVLRAIEEAEPALQYLYDRGFTDEIINREKIGYSPNLNHFAKDFLEKRGFDKQLAYDAGLLSRNEENFTYFDRFRDRIMFPINNAQGRVAGFSGRTYKNEEPKYLNSPETPIFQKRQILYHLDSARKSIRKQDETILLEGFMDVIKVGEAGILNAVATMGTALSREHQLQLRKLAGNVTLMFDGDRAGKDATLLSGAQLLADGMNVFVVPLSNGKDPDEMIKEMGTDQFKKYVEHNKISFVSYKMKLLGSSIESNDLEYDKRLKEITQDIAKIKSPALQKKVLHEASELFKVDFNSLNFEVNKFTGRVPSISDAPRIVHYSKQEKAERLVLKHFFRDKNLMQRMNHLSDSHFKRPEHQKIFIALNGYYNTSDSFDLSDFLNHIPESARECALSIDGITINDNPSHEEIDDYLYAIHEEEQQNKSKQQLQLDLQEAINHGDIARRDQLMKQLVDFNRRKKLK